MHSGPEQECSPAWDAGDIHCPFSPYGRLRAALVIHPAVFAGKPFRDFIRNARAGQTAHWPVASVSRARADEPGLKGDNPRLVDLTPDTVSEAKHRQRFAKFRPADRARIQTILTDGNWVGQGENRRRVSMADESGKPWRVVVKKTSAGELLPVTYHRVQPRQRRKE